MKGEGRNKSRRKILFKERNSLKNSADDDDIMENRTKVQIRQQEGAIKMEGKKAKAEKTFLMRQEILIQLQYIIMRNSDDFALKILTKAINLEKVLHNK